MSVSRPRSISMSSAGRSSQKGRRPSFLNDKGEVRLVENGFDLTPLPLLVDEAPPEEAPEEPEDEGPFLPRYVWARQLFLEHEVTPAADVSLEWRKPDEAKLREFLIEKMGFNADRVEGALKKLVKAQGARTQRRMDSFFKVLPPKPGAAKKKPVVSKVAKKKSGGKGKPRK